MRILLLIIFTIFTLPVMALPYDTIYYKKWKSVYHPHSESSYQHAYCKAHNGIEEYELPDKTRVDCLTDEYAIEFDYAALKWNEGIGQSLHYALMTGKKPKVVLILDYKYKKQQMVYVERVKRIGEVYGMEVEYISDEILDIDTKNKCQYKDCRCKRRKRPLINCFNIFHKSE